MPVNTGRKQGGRFSKGRSGNPRGKPQGARHRTTLAAEALLDGEAEGLTRKAIEMALSGRSRRSACVSTEYCRAATDRSASDRRPWRVLAMRLPRWPRSPPRSPLPGSPRARLPRCQCLSRHSSGRLRRTSSISAFGRLRHGAMRRELERRLQALETAQTRTIAAEVWIELRDGMLRGPRGEQVTLNGFKSVCARLSVVVILPDDGRDPTRP